MGGIYKAVDVMKIDGNFLDGSIRYFTGLAMAKQMQEFHDSNCFSSQLSEPFTEAPKLLQC